MTERITIDHNEINARTEAVINQKRQQKLEKKHTPKTKIQRQKSIYWLLVFWGLFAQSISIFLASSGWIGFVTSFLSNMMLGSLIALISLFIIEIGTRLVCKEMASQVFDDETEISKIFYVALAILCVLNASATYFGTEYAVNYFAAKPTLIDVEQVKIDTKKQFSETLAYWESRLDTSKTVKSEFWEGNKKINKETGGYKVSSNKNVAVPFRLMVQDEHKTQDSLDKYKSYASAAVLDAVSIANKANEQTLLEHKQFCTSFSDYLALASIGIFLTFLASFFWTERYERLEREENKEIMKSKDSSSQVQSNQTPTIKRTKPTVQRVQTVNANVAHAKVGFVQGEQNNTNDPTKPYHGKIVNIEGSTVPHVLYERKDGGFVEYKKSDIERRLRALSKKKDPNAPLTEYEIKLNDALKRFDNLK